MKALVVGVRKKHNFNFSLIVLMTLLLFIGLVFVYSASYYSADISFGDKFFFVKKQLFGIGVGCVGFLFFSFFDYKKLNKIKWVLYVVSIVLLAAVFIPGIGVTTYGATRWINLKILTFQPSEIAKFAFIVLSAGVLCKSSEKIKNFKTFLFVLVLGGILCALIILEPNMSITICMATLVVVMLFVGGANFKHFAWLIVPGIALVVFLIVIEPYRLKRIVAFLDPFASKQDEGFQLVQSILGVALGGFFGRGIFNSRQKYLFLPFAESDFIFSIIAEEIGFFGVFLLIFIFILLFLQIIRIAKNANSKFGCLLSSGIGSIIIIQVLFNLMVVLGLVPPTGLPLPFISAGSTAIMINMSMLGVVQNVYKQSKSRV